MIRRLADPVSVALVVGVAGLALSAVEAFADIHAMLAGWLTAALVTAGLPLGALTILMIHGLTGGRWGDAMRPPLRAIVATLPLALLMLLPILFCLGQVFPWAADPTALPESVRLKLAYLNAPFFAARFVACSTIWLALTWLVLGWSATSSTASGKSCAIGLVLHGIAVSVFSTDWMLSLEPEFTSTIYAMIEASAQAVGAGALTLVALAARRQIEIQPGGEHGVALSEDVANMLFGFVLMWAYLAFMQWLVVWAGDLPTEIHWYIERMRHGWQYLLLAVISLAFAVPFAGFLSRRLKRSHAGLLWLGGAVTAGHVLETVWRVRPPLGGAGLLSGWHDVAAFAAIGGLWAALFLFVLFDPERISLWRGRLAHG
jgi:hypothetical protein